MAKRKNPKKEYREEIALEQVSEETECAEAVEDAQETPEETENEVLLEEEGVTESVSEEPESEFNEPESESNEPESESNEPESEPESESDEPEQVFSEEESQESGDVSQDTDETLEAAVVTQEGDMALEEAESESYSEPEESSFAEDAFEEIESQEEETDDLYGEAEEAEAPEDLQMEDAEAEALPEAEDAEKKQESMIPPRKKRPRLFNFSAKLLLMCMVPMILVSVIIIQVSTNILQEKLENQIEGALQIVTSSLMETYNSLYKGDYSTGSSGKLSKGDTMISGDTDLIDALKEQTGYESSMIYGDMRRITTIKREAGGRIQGTGVDKSVYKKVMSGKSVFRTDVKIQDTVYYAYYQPLFNSDGSVCGMVGSARPAAEVQKMIKRESRRIIQISIVIIVVSMIMVLFVTMRMAKTMKRINKYLSILSNGDLAVTPNNRLINRNDELGDIYYAAVKLQDEFRKIVTNIKDSVDNLTVEADGLTEMAQGTRLTVDEVVDSVELINKSAANQATHTSDAAGNVAKIGEQIEYISEDMDALTKEAGKMAEAEEASELIIRKLNESNEETMTSITNVAEQINVTNASVKKIRRAATMIQNISEETDLLSLNASIEAARAGEAGKGFAVVAEQICKLADQSNSAAEQIEEIIKQVMLESSKMVEIMEVVKDNVDEQQNKLDETKQKFSAVAVGVETSRASIDSIRQKMDVLGSSSEAILGVIDNLADISEQNVEATEDTMASTRDMTATMEELENASESLRVLSDRLDQSLDIFKM